MGFMSWLHSLRPRNHDNYVRSADVTDNTQWEHRKPPSSAAAPQDTDFNTKKERRRSRGLSFSRPKSSHGNNRRSWFGGRPDVEEEIPAMPILVRPNNQGAGLRDIPLTALPASRPSASRTGTGSRIETLPGLPAMPVSVDESSHPATSSLPQNRRRSRGNSLSRTKSNASRRSHSRSRSSFWASSNPADDSEEDVPPVPALYRGDSTESIHNESSDNSDHGRPRLARRMTREDADARKSRPTSVVSTMSRKSYTPRSAAKGFLNSTNGASEDSRKSFRKSFNMEEGEAMVCLTNEQQIEWAKLMNSHGNKLEGAERPREAENGVKQQSEGGKGFSNAQALAALEFGVR